MPTSFYDTVVFDPTAQSPIGVQVLTSPSRIAAAGVVDYSPLLEDADFSIVLDDEPTEEGEGPDKVSLLLGVIGALSDPSYNWPEALNIASALARDELPPRFAEFAEFPTVRPDAAAFAERLFYEGDVAAEMSPLSKQTIATLVSGASVAGLYVFGGIRMVMFIGGEIGLVVIRSATAVVGALCEGARPEVQEFGGDATVG
jgi:hypothetical protein